MQALQYIIELLIHVRFALRVPRNDLFMDDFRRNVLNKKKSNVDYKVIRRYLRNLKKNRMTLDIESPGAGSRNKKKKHTVSEYARLTSVSQKRGKLLSQLAFHYKPDLIIELGTSLGVSAMYMAIGNPSAKIITVEGNTQIANLAAEYLKSEGLNIKLINGLFDDVIIDLTRNIRSDTLVFIDGNHTGDATLRYFQAFSDASVIVFDDIRWSADMLNAWNRIRKYAVSYTIIDLFGMGIVLRGGTGKRYSLLL